MTAQPSQLLSKVSKNFFKKIFKTILLFPLFPAPIPKINKIGLFHIKHPVPLVLQDQIVQSRTKNEYAKKKKLNQALTIIKITKIIV